MRMKPLLYTAMLAVVLAALAVTQLIAAGKYVTLVWEAEDVKITGKIFKPTKYTDDPMGKVSGNYVLAVPKVPPGQHVGKDQVTYTVRIPQTGSYYLWARTFWSTGCGNSFAIQVQGYNSSNWVLGGDATYDCLHWVCLSDGGDNKSAPRPLKLKQGTVMLTLKTREGGVKADQFLLTTDSAKQPQSYYKPTPNLLVKEVKKK